MSGFPPPIHEPPDRLRHTCPLGLRFFDVARGAFVGADVVVELVLRPSQGGYLKRESWGLEAEGWLVAAPQQKIRGVVTPSGILAFHGLPVLRKFENSEADDPWGSPHPTRDFQIEVRDRLGRFLPCTFAVNAPAKGLAVFAEGGSPLWIEEGAVPLFSAPGRTAPAGLAIVRMELHDLAADCEAAWALVEASYSSGRSGRTARGMADGKGRVLLMFAYPEGQRRPFNHSPPGSSRGLSQQEWALEFNVFYESIEHPEEAADYVRRLAQPPVLAWRGLSPTTLLKDEILRFGQELDLGIIDLVPA